MGETAQDVTTDAAQPAPGPAADGEFMPDAGCFAVIASGIRRCGDHTTALMRAGQDHGGGAAPGT